MSMRRSRCPKCQSLKVKMIRGDLKDLGNTTQVTVQCQDCNHEWRESRLTEAGERRRRRGLLRV